MTLCHCCTVMLGAPRAGRHCAAAPASCWRASPLPGDTLPEPLTLALLLGEEKPLAEQALPRRG